jgi:hypothetical protein
VYLLRDRFDVFEIDLSGAEALHQHQEGGQGLLLFGAHLGSFEVLRAMARFRPDMQVSMAMYPENARQINQALHAINPALAPDIIPLGTMDAMLKVHARLEEGALVGILADRAAGPDEYLSRMLLGAPARFPSGPLRMAAMLKQPVYFMAGIYLGGNRYRVHFELLEDFSTVDGHSGRPPCRRCWTNMWPHWSGIAWPIRTTGSIFTIFGMKARQTMRVSIMSKTLAGLFLLLGSSLQAADFSLTDLMQQLGQKSPARPPLSRKNTSPCSSSRWSPLANWLSPRRTGWKSARSSPRRKPCCWKATS